MWRLRTHPHDVSLAGFDIHAVGGDHCLAGEHNPRFGVGMPMQRWPLAWVVVHQEERDLRTVGLSLEASGPGCVWRQVTCMYERKHHPFLSLLLKAEAA